MGDPFLLCSLHMKYACYDIANPVYNARDPTTAVEPRSGGMHSGVLQDPPFGGLMGQKK